MKSAHESRKESERIKQNEEDGGLNYCQELIDESVQKGLFECFIQDPTSIVLDTLNCLGYKVEEVPDNNPFQLHTSYKVSW